MTIQDFTAQIAGQPYQYSEYLKLTNQLVSEGKTSGKDPNSTILVEFTKLNQKRMARLNNSIVLKETLFKQISGIKPQSWFVITEAWCGDSAQSLPLIAKIASQSVKNIALTIVLRDENLDLIDAYLTNGGRSIPKLIAFDAKGEEQFTWGPRPLPAQLIYNNWKNNPGDKTWEDFEKELHTWYSFDKTATLQDELMALIAKSNG